MRGARASALFVAFTVVLSLAGLGYAHWSDSVRIQGTAKMAHVEIEAISYKALTTWEIGRYSSIEAEISEDGHEVTLTCGNLRPGWLVWLGIVTQNTGSLTAYVKAPEYVFEGPDGFEDHFEAMECFYGPYPKATGFGKLEVWGKVRVGDDGPLKPDGTVTFATSETPPPFTTDPGEKAVVWIWIRCDEAIPLEAQGGTVTLIIRIVDDFAPPGGS